MSLRETVLGWAEATPSPTRREARRQRWTMVVLAGMWSAAVLYLFQGVRIAPRPLWLVVATAGVSALLAGLAVWFALERGRSMVGPRIQTLAAAVFAIPLVLIIWKMGVTACAPGMADAWPGRMGDRCFLVSCLAALGPFVAMLRVRQRSVVESARWTGATIGVAAASIGWVVNELRCQVAHTPHLLLGHILPIVVMGALGVVLSRGLAIRWIPDRRAHLN